jgi:ABC-2 type transport system ATP-binding protein
MIQMQEMSYSYDKSVAVLEDITLMEQEPVIMGLWGRNGAGKTTLMKLLAGHLRPSRGSVKIMGEAPYNNGQAVKSVCYIQEEHPFGHLWTVRDALLFGSLFNPTGIRIPRKGSSAFLNWRKGERSTSCPKG